MKSNVIIFIRCFLWIFMICQFSFCFSQITGIVINGKHEQLQSGYDYSGKIIDELFIGDEFVLENSNFSNCRIRSIGISAKSHVRECSFAGATIEEGWIDFYHDVENDFTNVTLVDTQFFGPGKFLVRTKNFSKKKLSIGVGGDFSGLDFSDFTISNGFNATNLQDAKFINTWFQNVQIPSTMSQDQFLQTQNFKTGYFQGIRFPGRLAFFDVEGRVRECTLTSTIFQKIDLTGNVFVQCIFQSSMDKAIISDAVFARCDLSRATDLTLEQIKSTWNYKNNRMNLIKLPPELQKALEEEAAAEKAKADTADKEAK